MTMGAKHQMLQLGIVLLLSLAPAVHAGKKAITDTGEVVILNEDGTWRYELAPEPERAIAIAENPVPVSKSAAHSFPVKSQHNASVFWIDPKKWAFEKGEEGGAVEYKFRLKNADLYGMAITEEIETTLESLADIALANAQEAAPDSHVVSKEYRKVNGERVLVMRMEGTIQNIQFTYYGYYHAGSKGVTQFVSYTATKLFEKYRKEIDAFLSGLAQAS